MNLVDASALERNDIAAVALVDKRRSIPFVAELPDGMCRLHLMVENVHCAGCIGKIERALGSLPGVVRARVNMSTRRLVVEWRSAECDARTIVETVETLGYPTAPFDPSLLGKSGASEERRLLLCLAVAGFAAGNVMLLSISVWAGHAGGMGAATRDLFHWISALIALPAVAFAGRPFFYSAVGALRNGALNMDVPISLAVVLAAGMSLFQSMEGGQHAYFDASVTLLFFLLIGRYLDRRARSRARSAAEHLLNLSAATAQVVERDGTMRTVAVGDIAPGMTVSVASGERIPVDGMLAGGVSEVDMSLVTGESVPKAVGAGDRVYAGTLNLGAPLTITVTAAGDDTLLAEIVRLMEAAEQGRARYVRLADRIARLYAPAVHVLAAGTFLGWLFLANASWDASLMAAIAVLIITCPCALGLAVPAVQVVASGRLLRHGVLLKAPDGLERLAAVDTVVFDKTGTLTRGELTLTNREAIAAEDLSLAASLARHSRHPLSRAIVDAARDTASVSLKNVREEPGQGLEGTMATGGAARLGSAAWCGIDSNAIGSSSSDGPEIWLIRPEKAPIRFTFADVLRDDAREVVDRLRAFGLQTVLLSGDRPGAVDAVARELNIERAEGGCLPGRKVAVVQEMTQAGHRVLMVGDGLNDAPALAAGFASMSPATAADVSQTAADLVFQGDRLAPVVGAIRTAKISTALVKQNFGLALLYNTIAVPLAVAGLATPLVAAVAMSSSSLVVTLNALRLRVMRWEP